VREVEPLCDLAGDPQDLRDWQERLLPEALLQVPARKILHNHEVFPSVIIMGNLQEDGDPGIETELADDLELSPEALPELFE
jgi:hypothetical protein